MTNHHHQSFVVISCSDGNSGGGTTRNCTTTTCGIGRMLPHFWMIIIVIVIFAITTNNSVMTATGFFLQPSSKSQQQKQQPSFVSVRSSFSFSSIQAPRRRTQQLVYPATVVTQDDDFNISPSYDDNNDNDDTDQSLFDDTNIESQNESDEDTFQWYKSWYPVVPVEILDINKPHKFNLFGQDVVVWHDGKIDGIEFGSKKAVQKQLTKEQYKNKDTTKRNNGTWRVFIDQCPHRKVPLSEGRVYDDGSLLCSYHAWRFNGTGDCIAIPQIESTSVEFQRIVDNPKSNCQSYPTQIVNGVLYVWPSNDYNATLESAVTPLQLPYSVEERFEQTNVDPSRIYYGPWNYRELPYSADYFLENVVDGAHVQVSHHGVVGSRYDVPAADRAVTDIALSKSGFRITSKDTMSYTTYKAPGAVHIERIVNSTDGTRQVLELLISPSRPGFSNHIGRMVIVKGIDGSMPKFLRQFTLPMPKWMNHILASAFLHQDALFLHNQERTLHETGQYSTIGSITDATTTTVPNNKKKNEKKQSFTKSIFPVRTDKGVLLYRKWLAQYGGGVIPYKLENPIMPPASNTVVFDVWNGHTKYCSYCQTALRRIQRLYKASIFIAIAFGTIRPFPSHIGNFIATAASTGVAYLFYKLSQMFYIYEFSHANND